MAAVEEDVLEINEAFYRAFNQKDVQAMDRIWSCSDEISCIHPGWNVLRGRDAVLDSWHGILTNAGQPRIVTGGAIATFTGDTAVVICRELVSGSALVATNVFVRENGEWRLLHHQSGPVASMV